MGDVPFVSVVLPVLNGAERLPAALTALRALDYPEERFEIIVVDGMSVDSTVEVATSFGCRVVSNPGVTVASGRNVGIEHARGDIIAFSEDDIVVPAHWLKAAVKALAADDVVGVGGPTPIPPDATIWSRAVNEVFRLASRHAGSVQSDRLEPGESRDLPGGNAAYKVDALRLCPIDEALTTAEDVQMHRALLARGGRLLLVPEMAVVHHKRDSVRGFFVQMARFAMGRVQLARRDPGVLHPLHAAVAWSALLVLGFLFLAASRAPLLLLDGVLFLVLLSGLRSRLRGEGWPVGLAFPFALAVFLAGWNFGYFSESIVPAPRARTTGLREKLIEATACRALQPGKVVWGLALFLLAVKLVLLGGLAMRSKFVMDEFQQGGYARHIPEGYYSVIVPFKTVLFTYLYYLPWKLLNRAHEILLWQRGLTFLLVLGTLGALYRVCRNLKASRFEGVIVVIALLCFSTFMERSFRLRAEPMALLFVMVSLAVLTGRSSKELRGRTTFLAGALLGLAFLCTQKAVWFCVAGGAGVAISAYYQGRFAAALRQSSWLVLGALTMLALYTVAFPPASPIDVLRGVFVRAGKFAASQDPAGPELMRRIFFGQTYSRSEWLLWGSAGGFFLGAPFLLRRPGPLLPWIFTVVVAGFFLTWKQPWPYVIAWVLPFVALWFAFLARAIACMGPEDAQLRIRQDLFGAVLVLGLVVPSLPRNLQQLPFTNREELSLVAHVESLLLPGEPYLDGVGMISTRPLVKNVWWDSAALLRIQAAGRNGDDSEVRAAFQSRPKVLVNNYRLQVLEAEISPFVRDSYQPVDRGLFVAGTASRGKESFLFDCPRDDVYQLVDATGDRVAASAKVDGVVRRGQFPLSAGKHRFEVSPGSECFVIPANTVGRVVPRARPEKAELFEGTYL